MPDRVDSPNNDKNDTNIDLIDPVVGLDATDISVLPAPKTIMQKSDRIDDNEDDPDLSHDC